VTCRLACGLVVVFAASLQAQSGSIVIGGSHVRYADSLNGSAAFAALRLGVGSRLRAVQLDAALSRFSEGGWAVQAGGQGTALWSLGTGPLLVGIAGGITANDVEGGSVSGTGAGGPIVSLQAEAVQVVAGASGGAYRTIAGAWSGILSGSLRAYAPVGRSIVMDLGVVVTDADTARFADLSAAVRVPAGPIRGGVLLGTRAGDLSDGVWGSVEFAWDIGGPAVLEASGGRYPEDVTGFTEGLFAQIGLRIFAWRARPHGSAARPALEVQRVGPGRIRIRIPYHPPVARLAIAGDWNGWLPVPLQRSAAGWWVTELPLGTGVYTYALLADDVWVLPDGVAGVDDGFGGRAGVLIVP